MSFKKYEVKMGIDFILDLYDYGNTMKDVDLLVLGEGQIDAQTLSGKAIHGATLRAKHKAKAIIALVGNKGEGYQEIYDCGLDAVFAIQKGPITLEESLNNAEKLIYDSMSNIIRLVEKYND